MASGAPKGPGLPLVLSLVVHGLFAVALVVLTLSLQEPMALSGSPGGESVTVALASGSEAGERQERPKPAPPTTPKPTPAKTAAPTPAPEKKEEREEPKATPKPTATPKSTPKPTSTPEPKKEKPRETPKPTAKATPAPTSTPKATPQPTATPEKKREPAKTPSPVKTPKATPTATPFVMTPDLSNKLRARLAPNSIQSSTTVQKTSGSKSNKADNPKAGDKEGKTTSGSSIGSPMSSGSASLKGHGLPDYYARMALEKLARNFRIPPEDETNKQAMVTFRISRDGQLTMVRISSSSGSSDLDQYALDAVEKTARLAPFPDDFEKDFLDVEVGFSFSG
ncbi:TonB family protein [bacterium]|nr:TonB family protein [bacterium]